MYATKANNEFLTPSFSGEGGRTYFARPLGYILVSYSLLLSVFGYQTVLPVFLLVVRAPEVPAVRFLQLGVCSNVLLIH